MRVSNITLSTLTLLFLFCDRINEINKIRNEIRTKDGYIFVGEEKILLKGVNVAHTAKRTQIPWVKEEEIRAIREKFGLNFIRLTIFWDAIEPQEGKINYSYLEEIRKIIQWCQKYEIYVLLDMHQDLFGFRASDSEEGDGIPSWAHKNDCPTFQDLSPWLLNYITPALECQFDNFWKDEKLQEKFIKMWKEVVRYFDDMQSVIGFEIINEPWPGSMWKSVDKTKEWEEKFLLPFYGKVIKRIREISKKIIFYETHPLSNFGWPVFLPKPSDENLVYAPHIYPLSNLGFQSKSFEDIFQMHLNYAQSLNIPMVVGEYGIEWFKENARDYIRKAQKIFDENLVGSAIWSYDIGEKYVLGIVDDFLNPLTNFPIRPFPERIKGNVKIKILDNKIVFEGNGEVLISCPELSACENTIGRKRIKIEGKNEIRYKLK